MLDQDTNSVFNEISRLGSVKLASKCDTVKTQRLLNIGLVSFDKLRKLLSEKENQENGKL